MKKANKNIYKLNTYIIAFLFVITSFLWLYFYNRFHIIGFQEANQFFLNDWLYFETYISKVGGLIDYCGSFLVQFYYYKWLGALIISLLLGLVFVLFMKICEHVEKQTYRYFPIAFLLPVALLFVISDIYIHLTYILAIVFSLFNVYVYLLVPEGLKRYIIGICLYFIVYFVAGGNAILYVALVVFYELFHFKKSYIYLVSLILLSLLIPYLAHLFIYISSFKNTYLAVTPFVLTFPNKMFMAVWLSLPFFLLLMMILGSKKLPSYEKPLMVLICYNILAIAFMIYGIQKSSEPEMEFIAKMGYEVEQGNWEKVLSLRKDKRDIEQGNHLATFYANIALSEMGLLSSQLFHYPQTGKESFFLDWAPTHFSPWYTCEQYYRLGIVQAAEHCAFEEMMSNKREYGVKPLKRLVITTLLRGDLHNFNKYTNLLERSFIHKQWASQQKKNYELLQKDSLYFIPGIPVYSKLPDIILNYNFPEHDLILFLREQPSNKKLFENLIAYLLLKKDLKAMLYCMNEFYEKMDYKQMPRHFEEALMISRYVVENSDTILGKFSISAEVQTEFMEFTQIASKATNVVSKDLLKERFGNTYWYYSTVNI